MGFTEVFGGNTIYPADVSYLALALTGDIEFDWPVESAAPPYPLARIIDVMTNGGHTMRLPDATMASPGETALFNILTASTATCFLVDHDGVNVGVLAPGEQWEIYLTDNTTQAGQWEIFHFGASTATVQPSALAGYGIVVTGSTLSQSVPVVTFDASPKAVGPADRASALVWTGPGTGVLDLPGVSAVGNNFFFSARNAGGGMLTLDPLGTEIIDGGSIVGLAPGEGVVLVTDGVVWYTLGRGQAAVFAFDYTAIDVSPGGTYTLVGSELNRIAYRFTGVLTTDVVIIVPSTVQQYWVDNSTTGPFGLGISTAGGTPVAVPQGARAILYCDGTNVIDAETGGISTPVNASDGGTGHSSYVIGDMLTASSPFTLARLPAAPVGNALIAKGAGVMPEWGDIDLTNSVVGVLPPANGGTGSNAAAFVPNYHIKGGPLGQLVSSAVLSDDGVNLSAAAVSVRTGAVNPEFSLWNFNFSQRLGYLNYETSAGVLNLWSANYTLIYSGGAERIRILPNGMVGIATPDPTAALHVGGDTRVDGGLYLSGVVYTGSGAADTVAVALELGALRTGNGGCYIDMHSTQGSDFEARIVRNSGADGSFDVVNTGAGVLSLGQVLHAPIHFNTGSAPKLVINPLDGGIATYDSNIKISHATGPAVELWTSGYTGRGGYLNYNVANNVMNMVSAHAILFYVNNTVEALRIREDGNVGIGTPNPESKFVVSDAATGNGFEFIPGYNANDMVMSAYNRPTAQVKRWVFDSGGMLFRTSSNIERMALTDNGKLRIGSVNVDYPSMLHVTDGADSPPNWAASGGFTIGERTGNNLYYLKQGMMLPGGVWTGFVQQIANGAVSNYCINPAGGHVGIGLDNPAFPLHVNGKSVFGGNMGVGVNPFPWVNFAAIDILGGAVGSFGGVNYTNMAMYSNTWFDGSNYIRKDVGPAQFYNMGQGGEHSWHNAVSGAGGSAIGFVERMRIAPTGEFLIGKTYPSADPPGFMVDPQGRTFSTGDTTLNTYHIFNSTLANFGFYVSMGGQIYAQSTSISSLSDARLKENVRDLDTGLDTILALKPRRFDFIDKQRTNVSGFVAQEVEDVLPDLIDDFQYRTDEAQEKATDGLPQTLKSIRMGDMIPTLVKAIQEQQALIEALEARLTAAGL